VRIGGFARLVGCQQIHTLAAEPETRAMRNRIETNDDKRATSFFRATPRSLLADTNTPIADASALARPAVIKQTGAVDTEVLCERTDTPLKMVFITRVDSSQETRSNPCRRLAEALSARGHDLLLLERKEKSKKRLKPPAFGQTVLYDSVRELKDQFTPAIRNADFVMIGSNVPEGAVIGEWVTHTAHGTTAFYDLNTPVTLAKLDRGESQHLTHSLISRYHLYLSLTGGPLIELIKKYYGAQLVRPLYGAVDTSIYYREKATFIWDLGYAGNFDEDRLPGLDELLLEPARHWPGGEFVVAGHGFLQTSDWPKNLKRVANFSGGKQRAFYNAQRFALNVTGAEMIEAGFAPGLQIFEAAACGIPIISDYWEDLESFFAPDEEILFARSFEEVLDYLRGIRENERLRIGDNARRRILSEHSAEQRAIELENYVMEAVAKA
jgi:spore maturation protein CgeB